MIKIYIEEKKHGEKVVLNNITLSIRENSFTVIKGRTGVGKTTLLNIIGLLDSNYVGHVNYEDVETMKLSSKEVCDFRHQNIAYIFQESLLLEHLTVRENIEFVLKLLEKSDDLFTIDQILKLIKMEKHANTLVKNLSTGQLQKVEIGRAIATNPKIIIADEPTSNLDDLSVEEIMNVFKHLNKLGKTVILVAHDAKVFDYASTLYTLNDNQLICEYDNEAPEVLEQTMMLQEKKNLVTFTNLIKHSVTNITRFILSYLLYYTLLIASLIALSFSLFQINSMNETLESFVIKDGEVITINNSTSAPNVNNLSDAQIKTIQGINGIKRVEQELTVNILPLKLDDKELTYVTSSQTNSFGANFPVMTIMDASNPTNQIYLSAGEMPKSDDEIIINEVVIKKYLDPNYDIAKDNGKSFIGKEIKLEYSSALGLIGTKNPTTLTDTFKISGIDNSYSYDSNETIYFADSKMKNLIEESNFSGSKTTTIVTSKESIEMVKKQLDTFKIQYFVIGNDFSQQIETNRQLIFLFIVATIILMTAAVSGIVYKNLTSRKEEIGIYFALGLSKRNISYIMLIEILIVSILAVFTVVAIDSGFQAYMYSNELMILPEKLFQSSDIIIIMWVPLIAISVLQTLFTRYILKRDPIKIINDK
ncbi:MAG: ATP-binding cassette domain-containing protein [Mycoplasmatales bacterium]